MDGHLAGARGRAAAVMAGAVRLPLGGAPVALGADELVSLRLQQAVQRVLVSSTVFLTSSRRSDLRLSSLKDTMGSGMANLQYASCLDNLNHTEAGRALPSTWTLFRCQSAQIIVRYQPPCPARKRPSRSPYDSIDAAAIPNRPRIRTLSGHVPFNQDMSR